MSIHKFILSWFVALIGIAIAVSVGFFMVERDLLLNTVADSLSRTFFQLEENIQNKLQHDQTDELDAILDKTQAINNSVSDVSLSWDGRRIDSSSSRSLIGKEVSQDYVDIENLHRALIKDDHAYFKSRFSYFAGAQKREATLLIHIDESYVFGRLIHTSMRYGMMVGVVGFFLILMFFFVLRSAFLLPLGQVTQHARDANTMGMRHFINELTQLDTILGNSFRNLKESNQRFNALLKAVPDLMFEIDRSGKYINVWGVRGDLLAAPENELIGRTVDEMLPATAAKEVHAAILDAEKTGYSFGRQLCLTLPQGERWFELSTSANPSQTGSEGSFIVLSRDITERRDMEEQVRQLAYYDALTGLPNRRMLDDRLGHALAMSKRTGRYGALMFIDLDNFKPLNDRHGHDVGDLLLIEVAQRLSQSIREIDSVARFGGDEFVVMLNGLEVDKAEATAQARAVAEKILSVLSEPYEITPPGGLGAERITHQCSASLGVVMFINHESSQEEILKWADIAMYQAKAAGRNQVRVYS